MENRARIAAFIFVVGMLSFAFNNCSGGVFNSLSTTGNDVVSSESFDLSKGATAMTYSVSSGTVSPVYQYSISYYVDFQNKKIKVDASKGDQSNVSLPTTGERAVSDENLLQIKLLLKGLKLEKICSPEFSPNVGGRSAGISIYTTNLNSRDSLALFGYCSGFQNSVPEYQVNAASEQAFVDLLNKL